MSIKSCVLLAALGLTAISLVGCVSEDRSFSDGYGRRDHGRFERGQFERDRFERDNRRSDWRRDDGRRDRDRNDRDVRRDNRGDGEDRGRGWQRRYDNDRGPGDGDRRRDRRVWPTADARY